MLHIIVNEPLSIDGGNASRLSHVPITSTPGTKSFPTFTDTNHQPYHANRLLSSLEVHSLPLKIEKDNL